MILLVTLSSILTLACQNVSAPPLPLADQKAADVGIGNQDPGGDNGSGGDTGDSGYSDPGDGSGGAGGGAGGYGGPPLVPIEPGENIQGYVDSHPKYTGFLIKAGVHHGQEIRPKDGDIFFGEPGAVLDGDGVTEFAFRGSFGMDEVKVQGLEIRNYACPLQWGAVRAVDTQDWMIVGNDIHDNTGGVRLGNNIQVIGNEIHHNRQTGIMGSGENILIEGNEVAYNNGDLEFDPADANGNFEAGGMKITYSEYVAIRGNHVHHNGVSGIWLDLDNIHVTIENNVVDDNFHEGIYYEISYDAVIRNNIMSGNGFDGGWYHRGAIIVASSTNVEVYGNFLTGNANGIIGSQVERGSGAHGPHWLMNLNAHHNTVTLEEGQVGVVRDNSVGDEVFTERNNQFSSNTYFLGPGSDHFRWMQSDLNPTEWVGYDQDVDGEFNDQ